MNIKQIKLATSRRFAPCALALAAALALGAGITVAHAANPAPVASTPAARSGAAIDALLNFSQAGRSAFDSIRKARLELFDGQTDAAMKDMKAAQVALITAKAEAPTFAASVQTREMGKVVGTAKESFTADAVPVGGDIVLADSFLLTEQHKAALGKANQHLAKGDKKGAVEVLKAGNIDVAYQRQWLPIASAEKNLDNAISLTTSKKFYDANMALKAIEDGVRTDSVNFDLPPGAA